MTDYSKDIVTALSAIPGINVRYEFSRDPVIFPCVTYAENDNRQTIGWNGNFAIERVGVYIKVWASTKATIEQVAGDVTEAMNAGDWVKGSSQDLIMNDCICKVMTFTKTMTAPTTIERDVSNG